MSIATGLAGLNAAVALVRSMRDAAKAGTLKPEEFTPRVSEIYDYIVDSKDALVKQRKRFNNSKRSLRPAMTHV
jgi:hypothetical protein